MESEEIYPGEIAITHSEAPVIVYPRQGGGTWYKGIEYSVTLRLGGTAEEALGLLVEFDRLGQAEGVSFFPPESASDDQPAKPKGESAPAEKETDKRGNWPGKEIKSKIGYIIHKTDGEKDTYELYPIVNGEKGKWPEYSLKSGNKFTDGQIAALNAAFGAGHDVANLKLNTPAKINLLVTAEVSDGKTSKGNFYVNPVKFEVQK